jgi:alpha-beta hydrolase superfamily lysophospholipase
MFSQVTLQTKDGRKIAGDFFDTVNPKGLVVYLHMMPATKESYSELAKKLQDEGYAGLAIDFRGHGASEGGPEGYLKFSDSQHQEKISDVSTAVEFIFGKHPGLPLALVGASIGANLALQFGVNDEKINKIALLSPGLNYRGIGVKNFITKLSESKNVFMAASRDDNYAAECVEELYGLIPEGVKKQKVIFNDAGHGTVMFERHPELEENIINFIAS